MSIATRTGDQGICALMYGRRVPKHHMRVEAYGVVDELNASLGLARASAIDEFLRESVLLVQKDLVAIMGELATAPEDLERYRKDGYPGFEMTMLDRLNEWVTRLEAGKIVLDGWATPGATVESATLDVCRTVCRRAERRISEVHAAGQLADERMLAYFNRLSDVLWLMARLAETRAAEGSTS